MDFVKEINRLRQYLITIGYPLHMFETRLKRFLAGKFSKRVEVTKELKEIRCVGAFPGTLQFQNKEQITTYSS